MMKKKGIKARKLPNSTLLFGLLCFFFYCNFSAQVFVTDDTQFYISKEATISQLSTTSKNDSARIYIQKDTKVTGLETIQKVLITYIEIPEKGNANCTIKTSKTEEQYKKNVIQIFKRDKASAKQNIEVNIKSGESKSNFNLLKASKNPPSIPSNKYQYMVWINNKMLSSDLFCYNDKYVLNCINNKSNHHSGILYAFIHHPNLK